MGSSDTVSVSQEYAIGVTDVEKAGWAGLIIYGLLPHGFLSRRTNADGAIEPRPTCHPGDSKSRQEAPKRQGCAPLLTLAFLQQVFPFWWARETECVGSAQAQQALTFPNEAWNWLALGCREKPDTFQEGTAKAHSPLITQLPSPPHHLHAGPSWRRPREEPALLQIK